MNGTSGFKEVQASISRPSTRLGSSTSNGIDSEQVPGTFSVIRISSISTTASSRSEGRFLTPFLFPNDLSIFCPPKEGALSEWED